MVEENEHEGKQADGRAHNTFFICKCAKPHSKGIFTFTTTAEDSFAMFWVCKVVCKNKKEQEIAL